MTDTAPDTIKPEDHPEYEPPVIGETQREKRNRKARNRRRAEKVQQDAAAVSDPPASKPGRPGKASKRETAVTAIVTGVGLGVTAFDLRDGQAIIEGAPELGRSLAKLADTNTRVARALDSLTEVSAWSEVAAAIGAIIVPIVKNHAAPRPKITDAAPHADTPEPTRPATPPAADHQPAGVSPDAAVFTVPATAGESPADLPPAFTVPT